MSVRDDIEKVGDSKSIPSELVRYTFFFKFNVGVRVSLRVPRLIPRALKLTTM